MNDKIAEMLRDINPYVDIDGETKLLEEEILDSLGIVLLLQMINEELGVFIPQEKIEISDFTDISSIVQMVERLSDAKEE